MAGTPECGALDGLGIGLERIDLDHPAKAIGFVGMLGCIEALVGHFPVGAGFRGDEIP